MRRIRAVIVLVALCCAVIAGASATTVAAASGRPAVASTSAVSPTVAGKRWGPL